MRKANPALISDLSIFIDGLKTLKHDKAFEVACGECHVTKGVLAKKFKSIDILD